MGAAHCSALPCAEEAPPGQCPSSEDLPQGTKLTRGHPGGVQGAEMWEPPEVPPRGAI